MGTVDAGRGGCCSAAAGAGTSNASGTLQPRGGNGAVPLGGVREEGEAAPGQTPSPVPALRQAVRPAPLAILPLGPGAQLLVMGLAGAPPWPTDPRDTALAQLLVAAVPAGPAAASGGAAEERAEAGPLPGGLMARLVPGHVGLRWMPVEGSRSCSPHIRAGVLKGCQGGRQDGAGAHRGTSSVTVSHATIGMSRGIELLTRGRAFGRLAQSTSP